MSRNSIHRGFQRRSSVRLRPRSAGTRHGLRRTHVEGHSVAAHHPVVACNRLFLVRLLLVVEVLRDPVHRLTPTAWRGGRQNHPRCWESRSPSPQAPRPRRPQKKSPHLLSLRRWGDAADPYRSVGCSAVRPSSSRLRILRPSFAPSRRRCAERLPSPRGFARARTAAPLADSCQPGGTYRIGRSSARSLVSDTVCCASCFVGPRKGKSRHDGRGPSST